MSETIRTPAESLENFLNFVDQSYQEYQMAQEAVSREDKRLQDLLHELEFAKEKGGTQSGSHEVSEKQKRTEKT